MSPADADATTWPNPPFPGTPPLARPTGEAPSGLRLRFPQGLPGFPKVLEFFLRRAGAAGDLFVLAAVGTAHLQFLTLPYVPGWLPLDRDELVTVAAAVGIEEENLVVVLMVNLQHASANAAPTVSVNLRAPILIDLRSGRAGQHILANPDLSIRHTLPLADPSQRWA